VQVSDQLQVDIDALRQFAKAIRNNVLGEGGDGTGLDADTAISDPQGKLATFNFGQGVSGLDAARDLAVRYGKAYHGHLGNLQALRDALSTLATAADKLAQNYQDAASLDAVSAKTVDDAIEESKPVTPTGATS
jgi:hypothetical protein